MAYAKEIQRSFPSQASMARRAELLFRSHFPQFDTRLFEVEPNEYLIFTPEAAKAQKFFKETFLRSLAPASLYIKLTEYAPVEYIQEIELMDAKEVHKGFEGLSLTILDLEDLLAIKYPDLPFPLRSKNQNNPISLIFADRLTIDQDKNVRNFFQAHLPDWPIEISHELPVKPESQERSYSLGRIRSSIFRKTDLSYLRPDEEFWFENLDAIFRGSQINHLITGIQSCGSSCYVDATGYKQIDLRQLVLLYDTIFLSLPIVNEQAIKYEFWQDQNITEEDFLDLVSAGRIKIVIIQPEERLDNRFLKKIEERAPNSIIGRRSLSSLIASDLVRTAEEYVLLRPEFRSLLTPLIEEICNSTKLSFEVVGKGLLWPAFARSACFTPLLHGGALGITNFGLGSVFNEEIRGFTGRDYFIEAVSVTQGVHIAHVLNATFIPSTEDLIGWNVVRNLTADRLNFYRSFNSRISAAWIGNEGRKIKRDKILPPVPIFDFHKHTDIHEIMDVSELSSVTRKGRALLSRLSDLPVEERFAEVEKLGKAAYKIGAKRSRRSFALDNLDGLASLIDYVSGLGLFPFKSAFSISNNILNACRKNKRFDLLMDSIEQDIKIKGKNEDLDFLTKVNRVAEISASR